MVRPFSVAYDDFSGGYFVDRVAANQPRNTWVGTDLAADPRTGYLMPTGRWETWTHADLLYARAGVDTGLYTYVFTGDGVSVAKMCRFVPSNPWPGTMTTVNIGGSARPTYAVLFNGNIVCATDTLVVYHHVQASGVVTQPVTPDAFDKLVPYNSFLFGVSLDGLTNRIYYSAPLDATSWSASDYYDVDGWILAMTVHSGALYIGTSQGWYVASGIPGETFSIRRLNGYGTSGDAVDGDTSVIGYGNLAQFSQITGNYQSEINYVAAPTTPVRTGRFVCAETPGFIYDLPTRTWQQVTTSGTVIPGPGFLHDYILGFALAGTVSRYNTNPSSCGYDSTSATFYSATAELAEHVAPRPFVVRRVIAELEFDVDPSTRTAERSISVRVLTHGHLDADATVTDPATSTLTKAWTGLVGSGQVVVVPFPVNDCPATYLAKPEVTLKGVKLRRLIMECMEVDG